MTSRVALSILLAMLLLAPIGVAFAQDDPPPLKPEELDALTAPIALYPDSLLSQVLMAATYPADVATAADWVEAHKDTTGDDAVKAVEGEAWDPSVKSLVAFPQVLSMMKEQPDWVQKVGDAFLAQSKDVMDSVQRLRKQAKDAGNLKSDEQQKVTEEPAAAPAAAAAPAPAASTSTSTTIIIEPADPEVVYVPTYNPTVVYGSWMYPTYPPAYFPPPPGYYFGAALATGFAFSAGIAIGNSLWGDCDWGGGDVDIDINKYNNINVGNKINSGNSKWEHNGANRKGVPYNNSASRSKYGNSVPGADQRSEYRGRDSAGATNSTRDAQREAARGNLERSTGVSTRDAVGSADRINQDLASRGQTANDLGRGGAGTRDAGNLGGGGAGTRDLGGGGAGTRNPGSSSGNLGGGGAGTRDVSTGNRGGASASTRDVGGGGGSRSGGSSSALSGVQRPSASHQATSRGSSSAGGRSMGGHGGGGGGGGRAGGGGGGRRR